MQNVYDPNPNAATPSPSVPTRGGLSGILSKLFKNIRGQHPDSLAHTSNPDDVENDARPGFILESDRYTKASWERQGSGWM